MSIINTQAVANAKKVLTGKNGALYNAKGKLLATMETYQAQVNVTNTKFQPWATRRNMRFLPAMARRLLLPKSW